MKIGFDVSQVAHKGGVANYSNSLALELEKIKDLEMVYFYSSLRQKYQGGLRNVKKFKLPPTLFEVLFNQIRSVPIEKFIGEVDVFHSSDWIQPPTKAKKVTTYHDVVALKYPEWSHPKIISVNKRRLKIVEKEIDLVIAVSEATKKDLMELSNIPEEKIRVVYEGVSEIFKPVGEEEIEIFKKKYNLPDEFVLAIGGVGERRNLTAIRAVCKDYNLIVAGEDISWIPNEEMPLLYGSSRLLLYPSFYEGFGLPILEAQACGVPVITSNSSAMPEIAGDGALLVDPKDENTIKKSLKKLMEDEDLRKALIEKGAKNAKKFNWKKCAEETAKLYWEVLKG